MNPHARRVTAGALLWMALSGPSGTGGAARQNPAFQQVSGAFLAVSVKDLNASVSWYAAAFDLKVVMSSGEAGSAQVKVLEGNGLIVELIQLPSAVPLAKAAPAVKDKQSLHGLFKAGAIVADFDRLVATLRARRVEIAYGPFPRRDTQRANVIVRDNEGNLLQFFGL